MATVREVLTKWGFKIDDKPLEDLDAKFDGLKSGLLAIGAMAAAAGAAIYTLAQTTANYGDEVAKTSRALGVASDELQKWHYVANIGGVKNQEFNNSLRRLAMAVSDSRDGLETYLREFKKLGIGQDDLNDKNLTTTQLMMRMADELSKLPDGLAKTGLASKLLGRSGAKLITMFNEGSEGINKLMQEAEDLGFIFGEDLLKKSELFNDSLRRIKQIIVGLAQYIGVQLLPVFQEWYDLIIEWLKVNKEMLKMKLDKFFKSLLKFFKDFVTVTAILIGYANRLVQAFGGWERVLKVIGIAIIGIAGGKILIGLGAMVKMAKTFALALNIASIKLLLIGALIALAVLVIEDLWATLEGKDTMFSRLFGKEAVGNLKLLVEGFEHFRTIAVDALAEVFMWLDKTVGWIGKGADAISGFFGGGKPSAKLAPAGAAAGGSVKNINFPATVINVSGANVDENVIKQKVKEANSEAIEKMKYEID